MTMPKGELSLSPESLLILDSQFAIQKKLEDLQTLLSPAPVAAPSDAPLKKALDFYGVTDENDPDWGSEWSDNRFEGSPFYKEALSLRAEEMDRQSELCTMPPTWELRDKIEGAPDTASRQRFMEQRNRRGELDSKGMELRSKKKSLVAKWLRWRVSVEEKKSA